MPSKEFRRSAAALAFVIGTEAFSPSGAFAQQKKVPLPEMTSSQSVQLVREKKPVPVSQEHLKTIVACALTEKAGKTITKAEDPQSSKPLREIVLMDKKNDVTYTVKITKPYPRTFDRLKAYEERGDMPFIEISENPLKGHAFSRYYIDGNVHQVGFEKKQITEKNPIKRKKMETIAAIEAGQKIDGVLDYATVFPGDKQEIDKIAKAAGDDPFEYPIRIDSWFKKKFLKYQEYYRNAAANIERLCRENK